MLAWRIDVVFSSLALSKMNSWYLKRIVTTTNKLLFCILKISQTVFQWQYFAGAMKFYFQGKCDASRDHWDITREVWESLPFLFRLLINEILQQCKTQAARSADSWNTLSPQMLLARGGSSQSCISPHFKCDYLWA